jgi:hypothetical protein
VTKLDEFWTNAHECERMAENALSPKHKAAWLRLAKHWLRMIPNPETGSERFEVGQTRPGK